MSNQLTKVPFTLLPSFGCIKISGEDSEKFLQGQITVDSHLIADQGTQIGAVCNHQGRCIALFYAVRIGDDIVWFMPKTNIENTLSHLKKYAVFFKTALEDASEQYRVIGSHVNNGATGFNGAHLWSLLDSGMVIGLLTETDTEESILPTALEKTKESDWLTYLAKARIPWLTGPASGEFLPHNMDLPALEAVDFKKGCFTGQEVVARMQYKGKLKSHMQLLTAEAAAEQEIPPVEPGMKLSAADAKVGEVICASQSDDGTLGVLALVKDKYLDTENIALVDENGPIIGLTLIKQE